MSEDLWEEFYATRDYDRCAYLAGEEMDEYLEVFFENVGVRPDTFASVGCGPAVTEFALAERHPEIEFSCYDIAEDVVRDNRELAQDRGLTNLAFEVAALPDLDLDRSFDLVYCMATLYFVEEAERALRSLFDHVAAGGYLIVNYPNEGTREWLQGQPDRKREFFAPVDAGVNLLTRGGVESVLGTDVRDYWETVGAGDVDAERSPAVFTRR